MTTQTETPYRNIDQRVIPQVKEGVWLRVMNL